MTLALGEHQDIARAIALLGDHNIGEGAASLGAALHLLRLDMVVHLTTSQRPLPDVQTPLLTGYSKTTSNS